MKRAVAWVLALLLLMQAAPVSAETYSDWLQLHADEADTPVEHSVQFIAGGEAISAVFVADGQMVDELPDAPAIAGKEFQGWMAGGVPFTVETVIDTDLEVTALYTDAQTEEHLFQFTGKTVYLKDVAAFYGLTIENNSTLRVDSPLVRLSETTAKNKNLNSITLTAEGYFDRVTLTIEKNRNNIQTAILTYPDPGSEPEDEEPSTVTYTFTDADDQVMLRSLLPADVAAVDEAWVSSGAAESIVLTDYIGDYLVAPAVAFDTVTLVAVARSGRQYHIVLHGYAEEDSPDATLIEGALYANESLYLTGKIPGNGIIDVQPVTVAIDGEEVLAAYDIKIYTNANQQKKGKTWQPAGKKVQVHFYDEAFTGRLNVYHLSDGSAAADYVDTVTARDGWVSFEANSFSTYAITRTIEQVVQLGGATWQITVTYDSAAGIPDGASLDVREVSAAGYLDAAASALGWSDADEIFYTKFLDISIVKDGAEIEPRTPVSVAVSLLDITDGADALEVVHFGDAGAERVSSTASVDGTVTFKADSFSVFGFGSILRSLRTWTEEAVSYTLQGFSALLNPTYTPIGVEVEEGLEAIGAYNVHSALGSLMSTLYVKVSTALNLGSRERVLVYSVKNGVLTDILAEGGNLDTSLPLESADGFAVVRDSGYRRKVFDLGAVALSGLMPTAAQAEAVAATPNMPGEVLAAFDITIDENGADYQPDSDHPVEVTMAVGAVEGRDLHVWHLLDDGSREEITDFDLVDGKVVFEAKGFSVYAVVDDGGDDEVPRIFYNFKVKDHDSGDDILFNTQIVKNGDVLYDPGFPEFTTYHYVPAESEFLGWYYVENGTEYGPIEFGGNVSTEGMTEDKTINAYAKIKTTYYVTFKDPSGAIVQVKHIDGTTAGDATVNAEGVTYTPSSEYVCVGWSEEENEAIRNAGEPTITETTSVTVNSNKTFYPVLKNANWIYFNENDGGSGGGASYTGPVFVQIGEDLSTKKPNDPTRAGFSFGGWYADAECTQAFTWSGLLENRSDLSNHSLTLYAKWTPTGETPYTIAYWQQNADDDGYTLVAVETVENNNAGDTTTVGTRNGVISKYRGDHFNVVLPIEEQVISNKGTTVVNVYYDREAYTLQFYFAREYTYNNVHYVQVNNNNEGFNFGKDNRRTADQALTYQNNNDYKRDGGSNTWRTVSIDRPSSLVSSSYQSTDGIEVKSRVINNVSTNVMTSSTQMSNQTLNITYWYIETKVKYGQNMSTIWPDAGYFISVNMTDNNYDDGSGFSENAEIHPLLWGSRVTGNNLSSPNAYADDTLVLANDNGIGYFLLYWRFEPAKHYLYRVYFSALSDEHGEYVEQVDKELVISNGQGWERSGADTNSGAGFKDVATINFDGVMKKSRIDSQNQSGTFNGTEYSGVITVYYDRHTNDIIFHPELEAGDSIIKTNGNAYTNNQTLSNVQYGEKLYSYKNYQSIANTYIIDQTVRQANNQVVYLFKGWYDNSTFSGAPIDFSDTTFTMPDSALNFYAKWEKQRAQVTLEPNGGTLQNGQIASFKLDYGDTISKSSLEQNVVRNGYTLVGWYEVVDDVVSSTPYSYGKVYADVTLRARWRKDGNIRIRYVSNDIVVEDTTVTGTTPPTDDASYSSDSTVVVGAAPTNIPEGYSFIGWSVGGTTYYPNNSFDIDDSMIADNTVILTAVYEKIGSEHSSTATTKITFKPNGGQGTDVVYDKSPDDPTKDLRVNEAIETPDAAATKFVKEGYVLVGWSLTEGDDNTVDFKLGDRIAADNIDKEGNSKNNYLYAVWQPAITLTKTVTGGWGDTNLSFPFTITVSGVQTGDTYTLTKDGATETKALTSDGISISLKHGESVTLVLPKGREVTITEVKTQVDISRYTTTTVTTVTNDDGTKSETEGNEATVTIASFNKPTTVAYTNRLDPVAPTGVQQQLMPYLLLLMAGSLLLVIGRRRRGGGVI